MPQKGQKKIPVRRCVGCGEGKPKKQLVRVVRSKEGQISLDTTGRAAGRGAYLCPSGACLQRAIKRKSLQRAFEAPVPDEVLQALQDEIGRLEEGAEGEGRLTADEAKPEGPSAPPAGLAGETEAEDGSG